RPSVRLPAKRGTPSGILLPGGSCLHNRLPESPPPAALAQRLPTRTCEVSSLNSAPSSQPLLLASLLQPVIESLTFARSPAKGIVTAMAVNLGWKVVHKALPLPFLAGSRIMS